MSISIKKIVVACTAFALVFAGAYTFNSAFARNINASASVEESENGLKVFIGDIGNAPENYLQQRSKYIENTAKARPGELNTAIIGFNDYYTVEDVTAWVEDYDIVINRAYMWPEGETGRLSLYVEGNDIEASIENYKQEVEESGTCAQDEQFAADYQRFLDGEYEVFALSVTASAEALEALNVEADCINYVDVMYNSEVETYAAKAGKAVSYIELPSKPDGAL